MISKKKFLSLETFRGFAALMIAAIHFDVNSPIVNHNLANGYFVHFFFTLSGFVIYYNYNDKLYNLSLLKLFIKKRFLRLYPLHIFFLILFLIIELLKYFVKIYYNLDANNVAFSKNDLSAFISNLLLVHTFLTEYTFNTPSWSISAEFITYIFFALFLFFNSGIFFSIIVILVVFLIRVNDDVNFGASNSGYKSLLDCIYSFYFGLIFSKIYIKINDHYVYQTFKNFLTILFLITLIASFIYLAEKYFLLFPIIFGFTILFSCDVNKKTFAGRILTFSPLVFLGKISYSIYMSHLFIFWFLTQLLRFIFKIETFYENSTGFTKLNLSTMEANLLVLVAYVITIIFSNYLYKYIEINRFYSKSKTQKI